MVKMKNVKTSGVSCLSQTVLCSLVYKREHRESLSLSLSLCVCARACVRNWDRVIDKRTKASWAEFVGLYGAKTSTRPTLG
jgi:hypothetical protein